MEIEPTIHYDLKRFQNSASQSLRRKIVETSQSLKKRKKWDCQQRQQQAQGNGGKEEPPRRDKTRGFSNSSMLFSDYGVTTRS